MKNKKILIIGSTPPPFHGSNIMCQIYLEALSNIGVNYYLIEKKFSVTIQEMKKVKLHKIIKAVRIFIDVLGVKNIYKNCVAIIFISTGGYALIFEYLIIKCLYLMNIPYIIKIDGFGYRRNAKKNILLGYIIRFIFKHADSGIILDDTLKNDILPFIKKEKLIVIPNTLKDTVYIKDNYDGNEIKLLFCANLFHDKGIIEFIKSIIEISKLNKFNFKATIIGDYESINFKNELKVLSKPVEKIVSFKGPIILDEKLKIFADSDIFIFPTYYKLETFGLVNLEAMRAGLPVISTNHAAIPKIVIDHHTGFIVPPGDIQKLTEKIILLIENKALRIKFGKNGRERFLKTYNSKILENKLKNIIELY